MRILAILGLAGFVWPLIALAGAGPYTLIAHWLGWERSVFSIFW